MKISPSTTFSILTTVHVTLLVASIAGGSKLLEIGPFTFAATVISYAFTFLVTDVTSELFGKRAANTVVLNGFIGMILAFTFFQIVLHAPPSDSFELQEAYEEVFDVAWRFVFGGIVAYVVSQYLDVALYHKMRKITKGKYLWVRNNFSTLISQAVDTVIFITIAFYGRSDNLIHLYAGQYIVKLLIAFSDTFFIYGIVFWLRKKVTHDSRVEFPDKI
jgi:uncharacterized integral membrane protein (TIGR00697 family)